MNTWQVVPLSPGQMLDVRPEDVLSGGLFRYCDTYRGGGGYDQFPKIVEKRKLGQGRHHQFVVQLRGCNLDCPYCYVTRAGVWGVPQRMTTAEIVKHYIKFAATFSYNEPLVFHLMGGAPAIQLHKWPEIIGALYNTGLDTLFHSDMLLTEREYGETTLFQLAHTTLPVLIAVDVKGLTNDEHWKNTRKPWKRDRFWRNLGRIEKHKVPYYLTFTACDRNNINSFWIEFSNCFGQERMRAISEDAFSIDLINYKAGAHVDDVSWGVKK